MLRKRQAVSISDFVECNRLSCLSSVWLICIYSTGNIQLLHPASHFSLLKVCMYETFKHAATIMGKVDVGRKDCRCLHIVLNRLSSKIW